MNRQVLSVLWPLIVLNVLALGLWLAASRWKIVLISPLGRGLRELGSRGSEQLRGATRGVVDRTASAARSLQAMRATLAGWATQAPQRAMRPSATTGTPPSEGLDAWIDEVEQQETRSTERRPEPAPGAVAGAADGSAAWWKAFAESGGALPGAAESCRRPDAATDRKAAIL